MSTKASSFLEPKAVLQKAQLDLGDAFILASLQAVLMSTRRLYWQGKVLCVMRSSELRVLGLSAEAHVTPVVQLSFLDGPTIVALSADSRGRVMHHNVTSYLSFTSYMLPGVHTGLNYKLAGCLSHLSLQNVVACAWHPMIVNNQSTIHWAAYELVNIVMQVIFVCNQASSEA